MFNWARRDDQEGEGMDVLLQLTLPIVLILVLLIVVTTNDLNARLENETKRADVAENKLDITKKRLGNLQGDLENTPTGEIQKEFIATLEQLQMALLNQALKEEQKEVIKLLGLETHQIKLKSTDPVDLVSKVENQELVDTMRRTYKGFGTMSNKLNTKNNINKNTLFRFNVAVKELAKKASLKQHRMNYLLTVTDNNLTSYNNSLNGWIEQEEESIAHAEAELVKTVLVNRESREIIGQQIKLFSESIHHRFQKMKTETDVVKKSTEMERQKLFIRKLHEIMENENLLLIEKTSKMMGLTRKIN